MKGIDNQDPVGTNQNFHEGIDNQGPVGEQNPGMNNMMGGNPVDNNVINQIQNVPDSFGFTIILRQL